jgi:hypothetical protein
MPPPMMSRSGQKICVQAFGVFSSGKILTLTRRVRSAELCIFTLDFQVTKFGVGQEIAIMKDGCTDACPTYIDSEEVHRRLISRLKFVA